MHSKAKIGLLCLTLEKYVDDLPSLVEGREKFAGKIIDMLSQHVEIEYPGTCYTKEKVDQAVANFEAQGCDGILVLFLTYSPSLIALPALKRTKLPIILWNTQEDRGINHDSTTDVMLDNHGVHGIQDLCNVLTRSERKFKVYTCHWLDEARVLKLVQYLKVTKVITVLQNARIGLLGYSMQDMGDFNLDEAALLSQVGPSIVHIPLDDFANIVESADKEEVQKIMQQDKNSFDWDAGIPEEDHESAATVEWAIREMLQKYNLSGWSQHFIALDSNNRIPSLPFLAASKLMAEGVPYAAEGDVTAVVASLAIQLLRGESTFTEMFTMDFDDSAAFMSHMGEMNIAMAREDIPIKVISKPFAFTKKASPITPLFALKPGPSTLMCLASGERGKMKLLVAEGEVLDQERIPNIDSPNFKWRPSMDFAQFLDQYAKHGGSHHQSLGYGNFADEIELLGYFLDLETHRIC